ncbi:MAG: hypothetical protein GXY87_01340 [Tissierellia bacterium]|nr:hypothetical protein [Tissierellia bacterium]
MFLSNTNQSEGLNQLSIIYIMYGGLIIYFLYKLFKNYRVQRQITGTQRHEFSKNISKYLYILGAMIIAFGIFNIINKEYAAGSLMIGLIAVLYLDSLEKIIITEDGIYGQGKYVRWDAIKKWGFDSDTNDLIAKYKEGYEEKTFNLRVSKDDFVPINTLIRKYKLKK